MMKLKTCLYYSICLIMQWFLPSKNLRILGILGILGKVKEYIIWYELQYHGFVHTCIILWVDTIDLERITNEIITFVPTIFDDPNAKFILPNDSLQCKSFHMVLRKRLHQCQPWCIQKGWNRNCKFEFLFLSHIEQNSVFNKTKNKWDYYRPRHEDQNVAPYHPTLLLLWGAHLYYLNYILLVILSFKICNEMWTTWNIIFEYKKCKTIWFTKWI